MNFIRLSLPRFYQVVDLQFVLELRPGEWGYSRSRDRAADVPLAAQDIEVFSDTFLLLRCLFGNQEFWSRYDASSTNGKSTKISSITSVRECVCISCPHLPDEHQRREQCDEHEPPRAHVLRCRK